MNIIVPYLAFVALIALGAVEIGSVWTLFWLALACLCATQSNDPDRPLHFRLFCFWIGHGLGLLALAFFVSALTS